MNMYKKTILNNNLTLLTHRMSEAYSVSMGLWFKVGSRYEDDSIAGISHFLEHIVFKGSKKYSGDTIKRQIEGRGGLLNAFTSEELTCYLTKVPHKIANSTFKILLDMAFHPLLKQIDIQREKTVIIEEIKMYNDLPQHIVQEQLDKAMWPKHPLGRNISGTIESVNSITKQDLSIFQKKFYQSQNMVIVFTGNIRHGDCLDFVRDSLEKLITTSKDYSFDRFTDKQNQPNIKTIVKDIEQTNLAIGFVAYERSHPKRFILTLLSIILGGNMSSRLFNKIREKHGLAYAISCSYKRLIDTGAFYIHAGLDNKKIDLALELTLEELSKLNKTLVSESELGRAKEFYISQLAMSLEDTLDHMVFLGEIASSDNEILDFNQIKEKIVEVKPENIREVAKDLFKKEKINISLVGPIKEFKPTRCLDYISDNLS